MLKRLELIGFKSFADKTEFDFPAGITGIVGPNGSGKSNIVDAVRWVLGEQSAKSLRGGEMTDVIFNGSASRRSLGLAEVTMTFDNSRRALATEAEEVQITRRVYRGGEGEYLINQQVCRLKDVKDLFLGSGAGSDAYCIIEQGRVDVLLQASTKERRTIFEEAAGISRFKAKKTETVRRLERVDQNLQRLRDILDEVEKQLRSVKLQAAKAQRYQEYSGRLKELRVALGLREYHQFNGRLQEETAVLEELRAELAEEVERANAGEQELARLEAALNDLENAARSKETELAAAREQIAAAEATLAHEWASAGELETELGRTRQQLAELTRRQATLAGAVARAVEELRQAEDQADRQRGSVRAAENQLNETEERLAALRGQVEREKEEHLAAMHRATRLQNEAVSYQAQVETLAQQRGRLRQKSAQAEEHLASIDLELNKLTAADEALQARLSGARQVLAEMKGEHDRLRARGDETARQAADLRAERTGVVSRIEVLEGLERSHEGLGTGPRELFALLEQPDPGLWRTVLGLVADFLRVRREFAPLIDLALGERAQRFLVRDADQLAQALALRDQPFTGRVSFLPLQPFAAHEAPHSAEAPLPEGLPGVVALAEQVVRCDDPQLADLPARLLRKTLIVHDLEAARAIASRCPGYRSVTLRGELLEADGTLTVGIHHAETGILSRKSELRELRERESALGARLQETERAVHDLREQAALFEGRAATQQREIDVLAEEQAALRSRVEQHRNRRDDLHEDVQLSRTEITGLEQEIQALEASLAKARADAAEAQAQVRSLELRMEEAGREGREREALWQQQQQEATTARVALAQVEERLSALRAKHRQAEADLLLRDQEREQSEQHLAATRSRHEEGQRTLLQASAALAEWHLRKEAAERLLREWEGQRSGLREQRQRLADQTQASRASWRARQEAVHERELTVNELGHRLDVLCVRLREDYDLDLAALYQQQEDKELLARGASKGPGDLSPAEEIDELRRKLSRLGSVNLEAIEELNELEARASSLQLQYDDLNAAQKALQDIIARINTDSRRLFAETFAAIRTHFQELFRKLFGGGMADIVLEDETDILESGIEVVARPPGKELRSISLMSGGEKTLTAVALLLAIFRSKPSPFCILDEVDAALDEANIGRFTGVLREFLDRSQFILITHSKRTMACADVLYGVTMQESGISKRIAVRFEDWPDDEAKKEEPAA
jgi:chromosome segregation protein